MRPKVVRLRGLTGGGWQLGRMTSNQPANGDRLIYQAPVGREFRGKKTECKGRAEFYHISGAASELFCSSFLRK